MLSGIEDWPGHSVTLMCFFLRHSSVALVVCFCHVERPIHNPSFSVMAKGRWQGLRLRSISTQYNSILLQYYIREQYTPTASDSTTTNKQTEIEGRSKLTHPKQHTCLGCRVFRLKVMESGLSGWRKGDFKGDLYYMTSSISPLMHWSCPVPLAENWPVSTRFTHLVWSCSKHSQSGWCQSSVLISSDHSTQIIIKMLTGNL